MERKQTILAYIKAAGEASLQDVSTHLGLTKQGTLRHLEALAAEGLVEMSSASNGGAGRPRHVYRLTAAAADRFPQAHRELSAELIRFMPSAEVERFFSQRAARLEAAYAARLEGRDFRGRVEELARLATEQGHMADVVELSDGSLALRHCNCPIGDVAAETRYPCREEQAMYARLLGTPVVRTTSMPESDPVCTYVVKPPGRNRVRSRPSRLAVSN